MPVKDKDFVIVGLQPWDNPIGSNCINIAKEIAANNRVLYINPPMDRGTLLKKNDEDRYIFQRRTEILSGKTENPRKVQGNLWIYTPTRVLESINVLPDGFIYDVFNKRNNRIYAREVKSVIRKLKFENFFLFLLLVYRSPRLVGC